MPVTQITNHAETATRRIPQHLYESDQFRGLVQALAGRFQALENQAFLILIGKYLKNAVGKTLTYIGSLVGAQRPLGPENDDVFRAVVYAQIAVNTSNGSWPELLNILGLLNCSGIRVWDIVPATMQIQYTGEAYIDGDKIKETLEKATAPLAVNLSKYTGNDSLVCAGKNTGLGFGYGKMGESF